jgi:hypothetical protein
MNTDSCLTTEKWRTEESSGHVSVVNISVYKQAELGSGRSKRSVVWASNRHLAPGPDSKETATMECPSFCRNALRRAEATNLADNRVAVKVIPEPLRLM